MGHPFRWTILCFVIYLVTKNDKINCQYPTEGCVPSTAELITTLVRELSPAGRSQLVTALLSAASNNGILPELTSLVQPPPSNDNYAAATSVPQTMNVGSIVANIPTVCRSDPIPLTGPVLNPSIDSLYCLPPPPPPLDPTPQYISVSSQPSLSDIVFSICPPGYVAPEPSYQSSPPSSSLPVPPLPRMSPPPAQSPTSEPSPSSSTSPVLFPPSPPPAASSPSSSSSSSSSASSLSSSSSSPSSSSASSSSSSSSTVSSQPPSPPPSPSTTPIANPPLDCVDISIQTNPYTSIYTCDSDFPVNLEINIPALTSTEPRITIVERPAPYPVAQKSSSLKKMLPLLLIAMLCNERNNNCCCNCNGPNYVPIPYPIPMPYFNSGYCPSCGNCYDDDDDFEDDRQRKGNRRRRQDLETWDEEIENELQQSME